MSASSSPSSAALRQQLRDHPGLRVLHENLLGAVAFVAELFGVEPEEVEEGGVVVVMVDHVFDGVVAELVRCTVGITSFETTTGDPHAEAVGVVVATDGFAVLGTAAVLNDRQAAHLSAPVDDGGVEQAALF